MLWGLLYWTKTILKKYFTAPANTCSAPAAPYELTGDVPNVVFPCAALTEGNKIAVYYGAADTCVGMAFGYIDEIIAELKRQDFR